MLKTRYTGLTLILLLVTTLGLAVPVAAQTTGDLSTPRAGGGLTFTGDSGIGVTGGVLFPIRDYGGIRSLGVVAAAQFVRFEGFGQLSFGGGLRWTRLLENVAPERNVRIYGQGLFAFSRVLDEDFGSNDRGFTVGGGAGFSITPRLDAFAEMNLARVTSPEFDFSYRGFVMILGVSVPLGSS